MAAPPQVEPPNPAGTGLSGHLPSVGHRLQQGLLCGRRAVPPPLHPTDTPRTPQPGSAQPLVPLLLFVHSQTRAKQKQNSPAAEGAIFMAGLNEEVFFDLLKILNII